VQFGLLMMPRTIVHRLRVDLGNDERNVRIHPERAAVVDRDRAVRCRHRGPLL